MLKYIYQDLLSVVKFLPGGVAMGAVFSVAFFWVAEKVQKSRGKECVAMLPVALFWIYVSVMLIITFFSRESGSRQGMDLELFSTWGINERNNAYVVENVLLFIPYGFLSPWASRTLRRVWRCGAFGFLTSLGIELLQLATQRGYFQIDDILTNTLGSVIGYLLFRIAFAIRIVKK
ncbi:MAG TPA: VanZ family protein [Lachnospiraceae bacterium]|nr:VanZ family protein [Lachnospiraceae bacterium]